MMTRETISRPWGVAAIAALILFACLAFPPTAHAADNVQLDAPTTVSDDITRLHVSKLDADTHEYVKGATMAIIVEKTGEVVDSWVTTDAAHQNEKGLDVDVVYILREIEAPAGFDKVDDVRFVVNETEGSGITILSQGNDAELTESYKVSLYDKRKPAEREIVVERDKPTTPAPKTGDETPLQLVAALVGIGILLILFLQFPKRRLDDSDQ